MGYVMILTEDTAQVAAREEDGSAAVVTSDAGLFAKMRADDIDLDIRSDQAVACLLVPIDRATARAEVAVPEVCIGQGALLRGLDRREELIAWEVVLEQEGRSEVEGTATNADRLGREATRRVVSQ